MKLLFYYNFGKKKLSKLKYLCKIQWYDNSIDINVVCDNGYYQKTDNKDIKTTEFWVKLILWIAINYYI